jgi:transcriptional regulator GlxA family with amidase domain
MHIRKTDFEKAEQAKAIIEKEYYRQFTYKDLACLVGTNPTKLQVSFKIITNKSLYEYHSLIRIERAMYLLENTDLKVEAIATRVGLDRTNLNKQFKKIHGISPSTWREEQEKKDCSLYMRSA